MALNKQPLIATIAMIRTPDESPNANVSNGNNPMAPHIKAIHPIIAKELPTFISDRQ